MVMVLSVSSWEDEEEERWVMRELVRGFDGKVWWVVMALNDFHASSVLLVMRDL